MNKQGMWSGRLPVAVVVVVCLLVIALASPYWFGRQAEQGHALYLQEIQAIPNVQVRNHRFERGYLESEARYELVAGDGLAQVLEMLGETFELNGELLRVHVVERFRHGPVPGGGSLFGAAGIEGEMGVEGSLTSDMLRFDGEAPRQAYQARVGFDGLVRGEMEPLRIELVSGPVLLREKWDARYSLDYRGGEFIHDLKTGRFESTARMGPLRFEDPDSITTSDSSTTRLSGQIVNGRLHDLSVETHDPLTVIEHRGAQPVSRMELEDQRTTLSVDFDASGRLEGIDGTWRRAALRGQGDEQALLTEDVSSVFEASREGEHAWFGGVSGGIGRLAMDENGEVVASGRDLVMGLHLRPADAELFQLEFELAGEDVRGGGLEPMGLEMQMRLGELRRSGYEDLWRLGYQVMQGFRLDQPDMPPGVLMAMSQAALEMVGDRPHLLVEPVRFRQGEASSDLALEARLQLLGMMMLGMPGVLQPGNEFRFSADVAPQLVESGVRQYLQQQTAASGMVLSDRELDEMTDEMIRSEIGPAVEQGMIRLDENGRYHLSLELGDGQLLLNGEPADWLMQNF
ncbi:MAG: YdgA family protein [Ectothiorhodospiraceae bacterium]|nr:YdgA family protein [Ectothiorhodospiraceae bacterium]